MNIKIEIEKEKIFSLVGTETAWTGKADGNIDRGYIGMTEKPIFNSKFSETIATLNTIIMRYGEAIENNDGDATIEMEMPSNFPITYKGRLSTAIEKYIAESIIAEWAAVIKDERTKFYQEKSEAAAAEIAIILNRRIKKQRNIYQ